MRNESREQHADIAKIGAIWKSSSSYQRKVAQAEGIIESALARFRKPYLAISGGVDSVAMAALVIPIARRAGVDVPLWCHISDAAFPGTRETVEATGQTLGATVIFDEAPVSAFSVIGQQSAVRFGKKGYFFSAIERFVRSGNYDLAFVGVRASESKRRREACLAHGPLFSSTVPCFHWKCQPICWMTIWDVAAICIDRGMPIHPIYSKEPVGQGRIRLGYITNLDLLDKGSAVFLRVNYPDLYLKLLAAYPEVGQYV